MRSGRRCGRSRPMSSRRENEKPCDFVSEREAGGVARALPGRGEGRSRPGSAAGRDHEGGPRGRAWNGRQATRYVPVKRHRGSRDTVYVPRYGRCPPKPPRGRACMSAEYCVDLRRRVSTGGRPKSGGEVHSRSWHRVNIVLCCPSPPPQKPRRTRWRRASAPSRRTRAGCCGQAGT